MLAEFRTNYDGRPKLSKQSCYTDCVNYSAYWRKPTEQQTTDTLYFTLTLYDTVSAFTGERGEKRFEMTWVVTDDPWFSEIIESLIEPRLLQSVRLRAASDEDKFREQQYEDAVVARYNAFLKCIDG